MQGWCMQVQWERRHKRHDLQRGSALDGCGTGPLHDLQPCLRASCYGLNNHHWQQVAAAASRTHSMSITTLSPHLWGAPQWARKAALALA